MGEATHNPDWKDGFLFLGNQLALDFLNTRPAQNGQPLELLPDFGALLRWFHAAGLLSSREVTNLQRHWGESHRAERSVRAMQELREGLRKAVATWEQNGVVPQSAAGELNQLMAEHAMCHRLETSGRSSSVTRYFEARKPEDLFAPLAHAAAMLFANADRKRVRKCAECVLHFQDTSKKGTRRWCSMRLCGNRSKVAAYAARRKRQRPAK